MARYPDEVLASALARFEAGLPADGVALAIEAWQLCPIPALADEIERIAPPLPPAARRDEDAYGAEPARQRVEAALMVRPRDPRTLTSLETVFECAPATRDANHPMWARVFRLLVTTGDPRAVTRLPRYHPLLPGALSRALDATLAQLRAIGEPFGNMQMRTAALLPRLAAVPPVSIPSEADIEVRVPLQPTRGSREDEDATRNRLFAAIRANPADDLAREVLADFLLERDDPRGELIALQRGTRDPRREAEIIAANKYKWLGPLVRLLWDIEYERGFPERARIARWDDQIAVAFRDLPQASTIRSLYVQQASVSTLEKLCADPLIAPRITALETYEVSVADLVARLAGRPLPNLASLMLGGIATPLAEVADLLAVDGCAGLRAIAVQAKVDLVPWLASLRHAPATLVRASAMEIQPSQYDVVAWHVVSTRHASGAFAALAINADGALDDEDHQRIGALLDRDELRGQVLEVTLHTEWMAPALVTRLDAVADRLGFAFRATSERAEEWSPPGGDDDDDD